MASSVSGPVTFTKDDVEIIARETLYDGFFAGALPIPPSLV